MDVTKIDIEFSRYIRKIHANGSGIVGCYTCGARMLWKESECGHYVPRANMATRFNEMNCKPQCYRCNHELRGNLNVFRERLVDDYGEKAVSALEELGRSSLRMLPSDLKEIYERYKRLNKHG